MPKAKNVTPLPSPIDAKKLSTKEAKQICFENDFSEQFLTSLVPLLDKNVDKGELIHEQELYLRFYNDFHKLFTSRISRGKIYRSYYKPIITKFGEDRLRSNDVTVDELSQWYAAYQKAYTSAENVCIIIGKYSEQLKELFQREIIDQNTDDKELHKKCIGIGYTETYSTLKKENACLPRDLNDLTLDDAVKFCINERDKYILTNSRTVLLRARGYKQIDDLVQLKEARDAKVVYLRTIANNANIRIQYVREIDEYLGGIENLDNERTEDIIDKIKKFTYKRIITDIVCAAMQNKEKADIIKRNLPHTCFKDRKVDLFFAERDGQLHTLFQTMLSEYNVELQSTSSFADDRIKEKELRIVSLFEFMDKHIPHTLGMLSGSSCSDIIITFVKNCTYQQVYDLILAYGHIQNFDNSRVKSKLGVYHHAEQGVQHAIWFFKRLREICPCQVELESLKISMFLSQIENKSELLNWDRRRTYKQTEVDAMIKVCEEEGNTKDHLLMILLREIALRNSALCNLTFAHIMDESMTIPKHTCRVKEKGNKTREFVTSPAMKTLILKMREDYADIISPEKYVFSRNKQLETKMGSSTLNNVLKRIGVKAGVTDVNIQAHTFRHTLVTALKSAGNDMETVSKFMGHNSVDTTINYYWEKNIAELVAELRNPFTNPAVTAEEIEEEENNEIVTLNTQLDKSREMIAMLLGIIKDGETLEQIKGEFSEHRMDIARGVKHIFADPSDTMTTTSCMSYI